ncbi:hypothetical protein D3C87_1784990 [compost metagenome]
MRWVGRRGDSQLAEAAKNALVKIADVLPAALRDELEASTLLIGPLDLIKVADETLVLIREVIRQERKLEVHYCDNNGNESERILWPFALGYFEQARMLVAWCELRQSFRHFRLDRIRLATPLAQRYPRGRRLLMKEWHQSQGIPTQ